MDLSPKSLLSLSELLKSQHPESPLNIFRTLVRTHEHQRRAAIKPLFPILQFGRLLGLDEHTVRHEYESAVNHVGRAYRAAVNGDRKDFRGVRGRPTRYVTEDGRIVLF